MTGTLHRPLLEPRESGPSHLNGRLGHAGKLRDLESMTVAVDTGVHAIGVRKVTSLMSSFSM